MSVQSPPPGDVRRLKARSASPASPAGRDGGLSWDEARPCLLRCCPSVVSGRSTLL